jgi:hypothetical protein
MRSVKAFVRFGASSLPQFVVRTRNGLSPVGAMKPEPTRLRVRACYAAGRRQPFGRRFAVACCGCLTCPTKSHLSRGPPS